MAAQKDRKDRSAWLGNFRRALGYLWPHWRPLVLGLVAAVGVSVFYTSSLSSIVPALKIIFADHETLADWLARTEASRRLGIVLTGDVPDDRDGLRISGVRPDSINENNLSADYRIIALGGEPHSAYALTSKLAQAEGQQIVATIITADDAEIEITLQLAPARSWWALAHSTANQLPVDRFNALLVLLGVIIVIVTLGAACRFINEALVAVAVQRAMHDMRCNLADHVLHLPVPWHTARPVGDTLGRFSNDLAQTERGIWTVFSKTVREPLKAVGVLGLTLVLDWRVLVVAVAGLPIAALLIKTFGTLVKRAQKRASKSWGVLLDHLDERLSGIRVVKAYNMEDAESQRFRNEGNRLRKAQTNIEVADAAIKPLLETLAMLAVAGFILYGGSRVFSQQVERDVFFAAVVCLAGMFDPVRKLGNVNNRVQAADAAVGRVFEVLDTPAEAHVIKTETSKKKPTFDRALAIENLSFNYPGNEEPVLQNINLTVQQGQFVAVVGPNGSGKTTLVSLLMRFFEPTSGAIKLDGVDIREFDLPALRRQFGLVTQDAVIFSGPVRDNIAYGANGVGAEAVERAAGQAHLDEFLDNLSRERDGEVASGLDAQINARDVSGGQRQRIALARAILYDPPILILDEATSQVDAEAEHKIQEALAEITADRTTIVIAHRFSTIRRADHIVVLNQGQIVNQGSHEKLINHCPIYTGLYQTQFALDA